MSDTWVADWSLNHQLETLASWSANAPAPLAIHAILAPSGAGKTALARQLIERVRAAGVHAAFLDDGPIPAPALMVADGAASMVPRLREIARAAIAGGGQLRLILLDRQGSRNHGWLYELLGDAWVVDEFSGYAFEVESTVATPGGAGVRKIFETALAAWSAELGLPIPAFDPKPFDMRPPHEDWHLPGYLWMAAREAYRTSPAQALRLRAQTLARRERKAAPASLPEVLHDAIEYEDPAALESRIGAMSRDELEMADGLLPFDRPALAAVANAVASRRAEIVRASDDPPAERARALRNLAVRLSNLDRSAEAAAAAAEAAAIYRQLGAGYDAHLTDALIRQAANARAGGHPSIEITREAVDASHKLDDDGMRARALSHHGDSLGAADRWSDACRTYRGAIEILEREFPHLSNRVMVLLSATIDDYKRACARIHQSPDSSLLGKFEEFFAR